MFGLNKTIAAQDPSYPVYVDTSVMLGNTGTHNGQGFDGIEYMVCTPENAFFPDLANVSDCGRAGPCVARVWCVGASRVMGQGRAHAPTPGCLCHAPNHPHAHTQTKRTDIIFFCSPNNPTGAAATRAQLEQLVAFAKKNGSLIVYDAAYALYITNPDCPKSIFEIEGGFWLVGWMDGWVGGCGKQGGGGTVTHAWGRLEFWA
jgi:LL-diaminopimelate aminotransferase